MDAEDIIAVIIVGFFVGCYLLMGSFWAWLIGIEAATMPWFAMVTMWPMIGLMAFFIGAVIFTCIVAICEAIFGRGFLNFRRR